MQNSMRYEQVNHYVMETILLYILWMMLAFHSDALPSPLLFFCILILGGLIFMFSLSKSAEGSSLYFIFFIIPVLVYVGILLGSSLLLSLFLSSFAAWRSYIHIVKEPNYSDEKLLIITFWIGSLVFIVAAVYHFPYRTFILALMVLQLFLLFLKKMLGGIYLTQNTVKNSVRFKKYPMIGLVFGGIIAAAWIGSSAIFFLIGKIWSVMSVFLAKTIITLTEPIFSFFEKITLMPKSKMKPGVSTNEQDALDELRKKAMNHVPYVSHLYTVFAIMVGVIMIAWIVFYFMQKRVQKKNVKIENAKMIQVQSKKLSSRVFTERKRKIKPPENKIRKLVFDLQHIARQNGHGRGPHETIEEWLTREGLLREQLTQAYVKVRYGEEDLSEQDYEACVKIANDLKESIQSTPS